VCVHVSVFDSCTRTLIHSVVISRIVTSSFAADVFAFGIVLWEVWTLSEPFPGLNNADVVQAIKDGLRPPLTDGMAEPLRELITLCTMQNSWRRPPMTRVVEHLVSLRADFNVTRTLA
jgi:hypothetical protein